MEEAIQFVANCKGWQSIKKLKITEETDSKTILEFLASLNTGLDRKAEESLGKIVDLSKLNAVLNEIMGSGKKAEEAIQAVNGVQVNKVVNEMIEGLSNLQKNEQKEISDFLKVYAMRKALKQAKIRVDYSEINIPGMKRTQKTKV